MGREEHSYGRVVKPLNGMPCILILVAQYYLKWDMGMLSHSNAEEPSIIDLMSSE
jgi:hypothetical protein